MYGEDILTSVIPMRLVADRGALGDDELRRLLVPFFGRYLAAFALTLTLHGTCQRWSA
jgi:hypothetical protein